MNNKQRIIAQLTQDFGQINSLVEAVQDTYNEMIESHKFITVDTIDIPKSKCGMLAPMIETCSCTIKIGICPKGNVHFIYDYKYNHTNGGSNGYDVKFSI